MTRSVQIVDVTLRDGLQNESVIPTTAAKVDLARRLVDAGARRIEAVSFVHPRAVPAMADAEAVMAAVGGPPGVRYSGLVLNERGLDRALAARVDEVNVVVCASDTFSRRNQNMSTAESSAIASTIVRRAGDAGVPATVTVATAFGCPFEGEVAEDAVLDIVRAAVAAGAAEVALADTIGVAVPAQVASLGRKVRELADGRALRFHFHDTRNTGIANAWIAIEVGADALDASSGGIGGCPFAPAATGNVATEDLVYLLDRSGVEHGLDLEGVVDAGRRAVGLIGREPTSSLALAGGFPSPRA
ncbi:hydroxymethylglutaryl-CoA lyase [Gordonia terrae]|uniref:Hydroxymethylglutaryl-CoA lyase n=2 Tax=Gordonia terrae TaxID=2055 RepID=A0AAD0NXI5_9ACTN|nr:hydroxymethylglutaryl-CoA lyase [Gordonia terrae]VTR06841.1 putative hydroxymethylglutaryl-CoA lyase [Clostridioides difficile]ANY22538.1 hydroxymethylglutaryl-CoA lyase [Gordonia terrae]AWO83275.1 hydroxymethylglutaryl-CoA lyase [Gordonia terrae]VTS36756.1 Hydroxymethylglutaryl-CoA lyase yngG [Gordonia terrae]GAB43379.1 putative hydroxymethylglutaryl-CoA lyase [Gordonia terrae NBRC 100016]